MELAAAEPSRWAGVILSGAPGLGDEQDADSFGSALRTPSLKLGDLIADRLIHDKELITPALVELCTEALTPRSCSAPGGRCVRRAAMTRHPLWAASILPSSSSAAPATR